ncbi:MAG: PIN domain-containing protein [Candidatus Dormibacteria bacterium]
MTAAARGLLDTSVFIATEVGREIDSWALPDEAAVSAVTLAELHMGVLAAADTAIRSIRLATLNAISDIEVLPIDANVAVVWARLRVQLREAGRRLNVNDLWIAATAVANDLPLFTQDADFQALRDLGCLSLVDLSIRAT